MQEKSHRKDGFISGFQCFYFISSWNILSFSMNPSSSSPTTHSATPAGVPVKIRSPIFTEKKLEMYATILSKLLTIIADDPFWTTSLFFCRLKLISFLFLTLVKGIHFPITAELSQALAFSQGNPFS